MENMYHCFKVEYAQRFGLEEAIMIQSFVDWIRDNRDNEKYQHEGKIWINIKILLEMFPFWTEKQTRRILQSLIKQEILISNNYRETGLDRTLWYTITEEFTNKINHVPKRENGKSEEISNKTHHFPKWENPFPQMGKSDIPKRENGDIDKLSSKINDLYGLEQELPFSQMGKTNKGAFGAKHTFIKGNNKGKDMLKGKEKALKALNTKAKIKKATTYGVCDEIYKKNSIPKLPEVIFDVESMTFKGIEHYIEKWRETYPLLDIEQEIKKSEAWVISEPRTRWKKNWKRFITNWLSKAEDWAERKRSFIKKSNIVSPEDLLKEINHDK